MRKISAYSALHVPAGEYISQSCKGRSFRGRPPFAPFRTRRGGFCVARLRISSNAFTRSPALEGRPSSTISSHTYDAQKSRHHTPSPIDTPRPIAQASRPRAQKSAARDAFASSNSSPITSPSFVGVRPLRRSHAPQRSLRRSSSSLPDDRARKRRCPLHHRACVSTRRAAP